MAQMMVLISQMRLKYPQNDFGLYDMVGNGAEWVQDVIDLYSNKANDFNYLEVTYIPKKYDWCRWQNSYCNQRQY
jgi:formylglycine-generating enzyme required for sulfatase activity